PKATVSYPQQNCSQFGMLTKNTVGPTQRLQQGQEADLAIYGILEKLCPDQLREALRQPDVADFKLESIDPKLRDFNERAVQAIRSLTAPESRKDFERLVRSIEKDQVPNWIP